jgi:hypothetical protein
MRRTRFGPRRPVSYTRTSRVRSLHLFPERFHVIPRAQMAIRHHIWGLNAISGAGEREGGLDVGRIRIH